jgi:hypothetical protein
VGAAAGWGVGGAGSSSAVRTVGAGRRPARGRRVGAGRRDAALRRGADGCPASARFLGAAACRGAGWAGSSSGRPGRRAAVGLGRAGCGDVGGGFHHGFCTAAAGGGRHDGLARPAGTDGAAAPTGVARGPPLHRTASERHHAGAPAAVAVLQRVRSPRRSRHAPTPGARPLGHGALRPVVAAASERSGRSGRVERCGQTERSGLVGAGERAGLDQSPGSVLSAAVGAVASGRVERSGLVGAGEPAAASRRPAARPVVRAAGCRSVVRAADRTAVGAVVSAAGCRAVVRAADGSVVGIFVSAAGCRPVVPAAGCRPVLPATGNALPVRPAGSRRGSTRGGPGAGAALRPRRAVT